MSIVFSSLIAIVGSITLGKSRQRAIGSKILYTLGRVTFKYLTNFLSCLKDDVQAADYRSLDSELKRFKSFRLYISDGTFQ